MGGSPSKEDTVPTTDNKGVLNGNIINNGQIIEKVEADLQKENILLIIIIVLKVISILIVGIKWFVKHIQKQQNRNQQVEQILLEANRNP